MIRTITLLLLLAGLSSNSYAQTSAESTINSFARFYSQMDAADPNFHPSNPDRETRVRFLQKVVKAYCSPVLAMKRASDSRPISDEVVVYVAPGADYRQFRDFLISGGSDAARIQLNGPTEHLPDDQPLVNPLTLGFLAENTPVPLAPACGSTPVPPTPTPGPTPTPPTTPVVDLAPVLTVLARLEATLAQIQVSLASIDARTLSIADRVEVGLMSSDRILRQQLSPPEYVGKVFGTPVTLRPTVKPVAP